MQGWDKHKDRSGNTFVWNPISKFVLKSSRERYVTGTFNEQTKTISALTPRTERMAIKLGYPLKLLTVSEEKRLMKASTESRKIVYNSEINKYWNPYTGVVFTNQHHLIAMGRLHQDGKLHSLTQREKDDLFEWGWESK
jgi:hypothetical protein